MKKIISIFVTLVMLVSMLTLSASADADIVMRVTNAEAKPGETVDISIYYDKNAGAYASWFRVLFDGRYFELTEVVNGEIFTDGEHQEGQIKPEGSYIYYAEDNGLGNVEGTGLLVTLKFKVLKAAPNGRHDVKIALPSEEDGNGGIPGFFFDATDPDLAARTVEVSEQGYITVSDSNATPLPDTTKTETTAAPVNDKETSKYPVGAPVTEVVTHIVTDTNGDTVTDKAGEPVVTEVVHARPEKGTYAPEGQTSPETTAKVETEIVYVTDTDGETVLDDKGNPETEIVEITPEKSLEASTVVIIVVCIVAVLAAAALIIIVAIRRKRNDGNSTEE